MEIAAARDLRNSEMKDIERCPWRWWWGWNDQLTPLRTNTKLWMGIGFHEALAKWYLKGKKRGPHPRETWAEFVKESEDNDRSTPIFEDENLTWMDAVELGDYVLEQYVNTWGKDSQWSFLATEQTFRMQILTPKQYRQRIARKNIARLVGTWDGVFRDLADGTIWLLENKSAAPGGVTRWIKLLPIDKQSNTYYMSATHVLRKQGILKPNENISGIMFNFLEKYKPQPDDRPTDEDGNRLNQDGSISKRQPKNPATYFSREPVFRSQGDLHHTYHEIAATGVQRQNYLDGITPLTKNPTMDCSWDCNFYRLCEIHSAGGDWEEYKGMAYHTNEDRYADHNNRKRA